jgi:hypothetical protein
VRVLNDFIEFASGTSSALASDRLEQDHARRTTPRRKEDEDMKRTTALAIFLGTALLTGVVSASPKPSEDIQAPRGTEVQAPRDSSEDIQAPRG